MLEIYHCDISEISDEEFNNIYLLSDESRRLKADKIKDATKRKLSILAEDLVKNAISQKINKKKSEIHLSLRNNGKPYIENIDIEFSISHSGNVVLCAISDKPVGIDIEKRRDININIAKRLFTVEEQKYIFCNNDFLNERFFELWTRKEAYAKMIGKGVSHFSRFSVIGNENIKTYTHKEYVVSVATTD